MRTLKTNTHNRPNSRSFGKSKLHLAALLALSGFVPLVSYAQNTVYEWNGSNGADATDHSNWTETQTGGSIEAVINQIMSGQSPKWVLGSNYASLEVAPGVHVEKLTIGSGAGGNGELTITRPDYDINNPYDVARGGYLSQLSVGTDGGKGTLTLDSNDSTYPIYNSDGYILNLGMLSINGDTNSFGVGVGTGSEGRINLLGSGKSVLQQQSFSDGATLNVQTYAASGVPTIGEDTKLGADGGKAYINVDGGSVAFSTSQNSLVLGSGLGAYGEVNVLGGGKFAHNVSYGQEPGVTGDAFILGENGGRGVLNISGNSVTKGVHSRAVVGSGIAVGRGAGSVGELNISNGAQLQSGVSEYWDSVSGEYKFTSLKVGVDGGEGRVKIDGNNSIWKAVGLTYSMASGGVTGVGELHVGHSGVGELTLSNGGTLSIGESDYSYIEIPDPNNPGNSLGYYHGEVSHTGGLGTLYLADTATSKGTLNMGGSAGQAAQGVGQLAVKDIQLGDGQASIVFNHTDNTGEYVFDTKLISGNGHGVIRQVAGTTVFAGQSAYTGDVSVEGGKLLVNGTQGFDKAQVNGGVLEVNSDGLFSANQTEVTGGYFDLHGVAAGPMEVKGTGMLTGVGRAGNVVVNAGGTVSPGASFGADLGVLTVDSVEFNSGSVYRVNRNPDSSTDILYATSAHGGSGTVNLNGGTVDIVANASSWQQDTRYDILKADAGVTGNFDGVTSNLAFLEPTLVYDSNVAYLYMKRNTVLFPEAGVTENEKNTAFGVQKLDNGHSVYKAIVGMSADQARISFNNLSGEVHADVQTAGYMNNRYTRDAVNQHLGSLQRDIEPGKNIWVDAWGHNGHVDGDGNAAGFDNKGWGGLVGADLFSNGVTTVGLAAGYEQSDLHVNDLRSSDAELKTLHLMAYGRTSVGTVDIKGGVGYSYIDADTTRDIFVTGLAGQSKAKYHVDVLQAFGEVSHTFAINDKFAVTPYAGGVYQKAKMGAFTETGSFASLGHKAESSHQVSAIVGVKSNWKLTDKVDLYTHLGWKHDFNNKASSVNMNFIGGGRFKVSAPRTKADSVLMGIGATINLKPNMKLGVGYSGEFSGSNKDHGARIMFQYKF